MSLQKIFILYTVGIIAIIFFITFFVQNEPKFHNDTDKFHEWQKGFHLMVADNIRDNGGLMENRFGMLMDIRDNQNVYWIHHPPLFTLFIYFFTQLFGNLAIDFFALFLTTGTLLIIYVFLSYYSNPYLGFFSAFFVGIHKLYTKYSLFINYETLNQFFNVLIVALTIFALSKKKCNSLLIGLLFLNMFTDWNGYFSVLFVFLYYFFVISKRRIDKFTITLIVLPLIIFGLFIFYVFIVTGTLNTEHLLNAFLGRTLNTGEIDELGIMNGIYADYKTPLEMIFAYVRILNKTFSPIYLYSGSGLIAAFLLIRKKLYSIVNYKILHFVIGLFFIGFVHTLFFNVWTFFHDFLMLFLVLPFGISVGITGYILIKIVYNIVNPILLPVNNTA